MDRDIDSLFLYPADALLALSFVVGVSAWFWFVGKLLGLYVVVGLTQRQLVKFVIAQFVVVGFGGLMFMAALRMNIPIPQHTALFATHGAVYWADAAEAFGLLLLVIGAGLLIRRFFRWLTPSIRRGVSVDA